MTYSRGIGYLPSTTLEAPKALRTYGFPFLCTL